MVHAAFAVLASALTIAAGPAAGGTPAAGVAPGSASHVPYGTLCLDLLGENHAPVCRAFSASRIDPRPDICQCLNGDLQVETPYCSRGEAPQIPTRAFRLARRAAALREGTLVGGAYGGRSYCIAPPRG